MLQMFAILLLSPLGKECGILFEQFEFPLPKNALRQVWLKMALDIGSGEKDEMW